MARMYSRKKGKSGSKNPIKKAKASWIDFSSKEIEQLIIKLAKSGNNPSRIGLMLRDSYGVPNVQNVANKKILKIYKIKLMVN